MKLQDDEIKIWQHLTKKATAKQRLWFLEQLEEATEKDSKVFRKERDCFFCGTRTARNKKIVNLCDNCTEKK